MSGDATALLATLPAWAFSFVLVMARVGGAVALLPGLGESEPPAMLRVGLAAAVTALLLPGIAASIPATPEASVQAAAMIAAELITGLWLGWLARMIVLALPIAGQFIGYMMGISNVLQPDPVLGSQATPVSSLLAIAAPLFVLASGLYALPLAALAGSYAIVPAGAMLPASDSAETAVRAVGIAFGVALQLASPFILVSVVWHVAIGFLARMVPRLQVYFIAMPAQLLGGMLLLAVLATALMSAWGEAARTAFGVLPGL
jgi:flagellar biosynthetic protein FliR